MESLEKMFGNSVEEQAKQAMQLASTVVMATNPPWQQPESCSTPVRVSLRKVSTIDFDFESLVGKNVDVGVCFFDIHY